MARSEGPDHRRVRAALEARLSPHELTPAEHELWLEGFTEMMGKPTDAERAFFARRRELGLGVGLNDAGELEWGDRASSARGS